MRNRYLAFADLVLITLSVLGAFVLRLDWFFSRATEFTRAFEFCLLAALVVKPPVFLAFGLYSRYWRYAGPRELLLIVLAVSAASAALAGVVAGALVFDLTPYLSFPRSVLAIDWLLMLACIAGSRLSVRLIGEAHGASLGRRRTDGRARNILVAGAGDAGALVVREMQKNPQLGMRPIGFLDDQPSKTGKRIHQVPVVGPLSSLPSVVADRVVDEVVIAMPTASGATIRAVLDQCRQAGVPARAMPGLFELLDGGVSVSRLRQIEIADLLRRRQIETTPDAGRYLAGQHVLVTGAGGSIGSELCRQAAREPIASLTLVGHGENSIFEVLTRLRESHPSLAIRPVIVDIRDEARLAETFTEHRPGIVFHAAAHTHVPLMEQHAGEAVLNNVLGTRSVIRASLGAGVERLVLVSTDKAVAPTSVMGATKRVAEMQVRQAARGGHLYTAVRFGNVLGSRGSVVPFFKSQIEQGRPLTITDAEMKRFFMTIPEAAYLVIKAGGLASGGDLFVLNMGEPVRILDLVQDLVRLSGLDPAEVPITFTGMRPGEKLEEALWEPDSLVEPAGGADVFRVREVADLPPEAVLDDTVERLAAAARRDDVLAIHHLLSELVPTFVSSLHTGLPAASR
jgi:FlaA1/EpsC-like NDP-sugar epimerase